MSAKFDVLGNTVRAVVSEVSVVLVDETDVRIDYGGTRSGEEPVRVSPGARSSPPRRPATVTDRDPLKWTGAFRSGTSTEGPNGRSTSTTVCGFTDGNRRGSSTEQDLAVQLEKLKGCDKVFDDQPGELRTLWRGLEPDPHDLLITYPSEPMTMWPISTRVNKAENDDRSLLDRAVKKRIACYL